MSNENQLSKSLENFNSIYREIAEVIGVDNMIRFYQYFSGRTIFFPKKLYTREYIQHYVELHFDGTNLQKLARIFGYTERGIKKIIQSS